MSWVGRGNKNLNVGRWSDGAQFEKVVSADTSDDAPSLSILNGNLNVSWTGSGNGLVNIMSIDTYHFGFGQKRTFATMSDRTPTVISYRWPGTRDTEMALPLFIMSRGTTNVAERFWSDLTSPPDTQAEAVVHPAYVVSTIIYSPPGTSASWPKSTVTYGEDASLGTSLTIADSFKAEHKFTATAGFGQTSVSVGGGLTASTQDQETTEVRVNTSTSARYSGPSRDGLDHDMDIIVLWLNPQVTISLTTTDVRWTLAPRDGRAPAKVEVRVRWLKYPQEMPRGVAQALDYAGIRQDDYSKILAHHPFALTDTPRLDPERFWPANTTFPYEPPPVAGDVPPTWSYSQSIDASRSSSTSSDRSYSVSLSFATGFDVAGVKASLKDEQSWTWTSKVSRVSSTTSKQKAELVLTGPAYGYAGPTTFEVYWDALYRSFMFVPWEPWKEPISQKPGAATGLSGTVVQPDGSPASHAEVILRYPNGTSFRTFTTRSGAFDIPRAPRKDGIVSVGTHSEPVAGGTSSVVITLEEQATSTVPRPTNVR